MKKRIGIITITVVLISIAFAMSAQAAEEDTTIIVNVVTDGNVSASFNATANGTVSYWIDGIEVKGEFNSIWSFLKFLEDEVLNAKESASSAFMYALSNAQIIQEQGAELEEHNQTLLIHYNAINDTYTKLYILRDEVVAFEGHYLGFVNETNSTLGSYGEQITVLKAQLEDLNGIILLARNSLIGLGLVAATFFLVNRRYPLAELTKNGKGLRANGKKRRVIDFIHGTEATKKTGKKASQLKTKKVHARLKAKKSLAHRLFPFLFYHK